MQEFLKKLDFFKNEIECGERDSSFCLRCFVVVCAAWTALWALLPLLLLGNPYIDILESVVWGRYFQFGYDRDPYLIALLAKAVYFSSGEWVEAFYVLSPLSVFASLLCIWLLARQFLQPGQALIAALLPLCVLFYGIKTLEFNDDVLEVSLWAATILFSRQALLRQRLSDWFFAGLFAGLALMAKYYSFALFASLAIFALATEEGRSSLKKPGFYLACAVFIAISIPNALWLSSNDYVTLSYCLGRGFVSASRMQSVSHHFIELFNCCRYVLTPILPALVAILLVFHRRAGCPRPEISKFDKLFAAVVGLGPIVATMLFTFATGGSVKYSWLTPDFILAGVFFSVFWKPFVSKERIWAFLAFLCVLTLLSALVFTTRSLYLLPCKKTQCIYESFPGKKVAAEIDKAWAKETGGAPLRYVVGPREETCNIAVFSKSRPKPFFLANPNFSQWVDKNDLRRSGFVALWKSDEDTLSQWAERVGIDEQAIGSAKSIALPRATRNPFASWKIFAPKTVEVNFIIVKPSLCAFAS